MENRKALVEFKCDRICLAIYETKENCYYNTWWKENRERNSSKRLWTFLNSVKV